jgi:hypothetical protein
MHLLIQLLSNQERQGIIFTIIYNRHMKRFLKISLGIILVVGIILLGAWYFARKTAEKAGTTKPSFRQFLSGQTTPGATPGAGDGSTSSVFVDNGLTNTNTSTGTAGSTIGTNTSTFTNGATTPTGANNGGTDPTNGSTGSASGQGAGSGTGGGSGIGGTGSTTQPPLSTTGTSALAECSDNDLNITFTVKEQARLQALQDRFYTIAQTLHTDADAATELANYTGFAVKAQKINDLLLYCKAATKNITDPTYTKKVPTPFWYEPLQIRRNVAQWSLVDPSDPTATPVDPSAIELLSSGIPLGYLSNPGQVGGMQTHTDDKTNGIRALEQVLRLNLW